MNIVLKLWALKGLRDRQEFLGHTLRTAMCARVRDTNMEDLESFPTIH